MKRRKNHLVKTNPIHSLHKITQEKVYTLNIAKKIIDIDITLASTTSPDSLKIFIVDLTSFSIKTIFLEKEYLDP